VFLLGVAEASTGVVVTGDLAGPADLGGGLLTPKSATDIAIAEYGIANGSYVASTRFGNSTPAGTGSVGAGFLRSIGPGGAPIVFGVDTCDPAGTPACNQIDLGQGLSAPGGGPGTDGYVGRYSIVNGTPAWLIRLSGPGNDKILAATTSGPANSIFVGAWYDQDTVLSSGSNSLSFTNAGSRDVLIFQADTYTGTLEATSTIATAALEDIGGIVWDGANVVATGRFNGKTTIGTRTFTSRGDDAWVAKLTPTGAPVWATALGGSGDDSTSQVVVDAAGDIYLAGTVGGTATFGTFQVGGAGGSDVFVAKLKGTNGSVIWANSLGSSANDSAADLAINLSSDLLLAADVSGPVTSSGPAFGAQDALFASFDADGNRRWTKVLGTVGTDYAWRVASGSDGFYALYDPGADIGNNVEGVPIQGAAQPAGVLIKIAP
jgi:hypothetical protein